MADRPAIDHEARLLALQAAVFRVLREHGLEPALSDTSAGAVSPAATFDEQMFRVSLASTVVAELRATIGLDETERPWVYGVVHAACRRHERQQREPAREPRAEPRRPARVKPAATPTAPPVRRSAVATAVTAATSAVVFRRRGGGHE